MSSTADIRNCRLTFYELLGVSPAATEVDIEGAYRRVSKAYHPDVAGPISNSALFREVTAARDTLTDRNARRHYDEWLGRSSTSPPPTNAPERPPQRPTESGRASASADQATRSSTPRMRRSFPLLLIAVVTYVVGRLLDQFGIQVHSLQIALSGHELARLSVIPAITYIFLSKKRAKTLYSSSAVLFCKLAGRARK